MRTKWLVLLVALLAVVGLSACGSSGGGGDSDVSSPEDPSDLDYVGVTNCLVCHERPTSVWIDTLDTPVSNGMNERSNAHGNANGRPPLGYYGNDIEDCNECHDPAGDGDTLVEDFSASSDRPVVGCEGCHGPGSAHRGVGPIPVPQPGIEDCAHCHNAHGNNIDSLEDDFDQSNHASQTKGSSSYCQRCHSYEGALAFGDEATGNRDVMLALTEPGLDSAQPMTCATCHDEHYFGFLVPLDWSFDGDPQFDLCTSCHTLLDPEIGDDWVKGNSYHEDRASRTIADTHYDNPDTPDTAIEGYVVRNNGSAACADCHDVHAAENTINNQWAESQHAGEILLVKTAADDASENIFNAAVLDASWSNRNWNQIWDDEAKTELDRGECQVCHTATGVMNFLDDPTSPDALAGYDLTGNDNDFGHLDSWTYFEGSPQGELLYCWGCHSNVAQGSLLNNAPISLHSRLPDDLSAPELIGTVPDKGNSNVCIKCHGGRANGEYLRDTAAVDRSSRGQIHHRPAAGTLFSENTNTGYEFDLDGDGDAAEHYVNNDLEHDEIGLNGDDPDSGSGPCVSCHMPGSDHHFAVVEKSGDTITAITSQTLCDSCHGGAIDAEVLNTLSDQFQNALVFYEDVATLSNGQTNYVPADFDDGDFLESRGDSVSGQNDYGAWQNFDYLDDDPGSFAHNSIYAKRIIFDSLDWLQHGDLTGAITVDETVYPGAAAWFDANAATNEATRP